MSDELPDTDDPYRLLGVSRDADRRTVKRAHARLIKRHRPDRDPDSFKRVQEAYEEILRRLKLKERFAGLTLVTEPDGGPGDGHGHAHAEDELAAPARDDATMREPWPARPDAEFLGSPAEWVLRGIRSGRPIDIDTLDALEPADLAQLALHEESRWASLRAPGTEGIRHALHRARVEALILGGRVGQALEEADEPVTRADAIADPALERQLWTIAAAACWSEPERAAALAAALGDGPVVEEDSDPRGVYDDIRRVRTAWEHLTGHHPCPPALQDYLRLSRLIGYGATEALIARTRAELADDPDAHLAFFDALASRSEALVEFVHTSIGLDALDSLSRSGSDALDDALERCEDEIRDHPAARAARRAPAYVVTMVWFAVASGGWAWLLPVVGVPAVAWRARQRQDDVYLDVRRALLELSIATGASATGARDWAGADVQRFQALGKWLERVDADPGLLLATEVAALSDQWARDD